MPCVQGFHDLTSSVVWKATRIAESIPQIHIPQEGTFVIFLVLIIINLWIKVYAAVMSV